MKLLFKLIYLKNQVKSDLKTSYKWRNNQEIWENTIGGGNWKGQSKITLDDELKWFKKIKKQNRKNLSIFLEENILIGSIYFTEIKNKTANFHIVIGDKKYWNKGYGYRATLLSLNFAKINFGLNKIYLYVRKENRYAIRIFKKTGFKIIKSNDNKIFPYINKMRYLIK